MGYLPQFNTASNEMIAIALIAALVALGATGVLFAAILVVRVWGNWAREQQGLALDIWRPLFAGTLAGDVVSVRGVRHYDARAAMSLYAQYAHSVKGDASLALTAFARRCGMEDWALAYLHHRRMSDRVLAAVVLGYLGGARAFTGLLALTRDRHSVLSLAAARAVMRIDAPRASKAVLELARVRADWPTQRLISMLRETPCVAVWNALAAELEGTAKKDLPRMLELAAALPPDRSGQTARQALEASSDPDVIVKALGLLSDPRDAQRIRPLLTHANWIVRLASVKALGRVGLQQDLPGLTAALSDSVWWVRQRAAEAITKSPFLDAPHMERLLHATTDPYAAEALRRAIAERR